MTENSTPGPEQGKPVTPPVRGWEYARLGDYHRHLDLNWSYAPTYLAKMQIVRDFISKAGPTRHILDAGCGEGLLVEEFRSKGFQIDGIDLNYESSFVKLGDLRNLPYGDNTVDVVLLLDVFEHFEYSEQPKVLDEIWRVLKPEGDLIITVPNLLHWNSRFEVVFFGKLDRADSDLNHPGERPLSEYKKILTDHSFRIDTVRGITLSVPILIRLIRHFPKQLLWLHNLLGRFAVPVLSQFVYLECRKKVNTDWKPQ